MTPPTAGGRAEVLVTGSSGFIGQHLVRACRKAGRAVRGVDVRPGPPALRDLCETVTASAGDGAVLADVRAGRYAAVLHQGAISSTLEEGRQALHENNVRQPLALAAACAVSGALFVYASSNSVYGRIGAAVPVTEEAVDAALCSGPLNRYAESKLLLDRSMTERWPQGLRWVGLRYTNVFGTDETHKGPMASIISQMLCRAAQDEPLRMFADALNASRDYIPVGTVAETIVELLRHPVPSGVYNLGSGVPVSFATVAEWCAAFRGDDRLSLELVRNPLPTRYQYWTCADMRKLRRALPGLPVYGLAEVRQAAADLFADFAGGARDRAELAAVGGDAP